MIPIKQTVFDSLYGNCLQACVASVLEKDLQHVPNFMLFEDHWWSALLMWSGTNGYSIEYIEGQAPCNSNYYIVSLKFGKHRKGISHAVIMRRGNIVHDPWVDINYTYADSVVHGYYKIETKVTIKT